MEIEKLLAMSADYPGFPGKNNKKVLCIKLLIRQKLGVVSFAGGAALVNIIQLPEL